MAGLAPRRLELMEGNRLQGGTFLAQTGKGAWVESVRRCLLVHKEWRIMTSHEQPPLAFPPTQESTPSSQGLVGFLPRHRDHERKALADGARVAGMSFLVSEGSELPISVAT